MSNNQVIGLIAGIALVLLAFGALLTLEVEDYGRGTPQAGSQWGECDWTTRVEVYGFTVYESVEETVCTFS